MKTFLKYEFTPTEWATLRKLIEQTTTNPDGEPVTSWKDCAVVELGKLCVEWGKDAEDKPICIKENTKVSIDILWYVEPLANFSAYEVFPEPCGVHTFSGDDSLYLKAYCAKFPDSEYCKIPTPIENENIS